MKTKLPKAILIFSIIFVCLNSAVSAQTITTIAGNGTAGFTGDGAAATACQLFFPFGVTTDAAGNIYIADTDNNRVRKITVATGIISTVAGDGTGAYSGDGGQAIGAQLFYPHGICIDASGNIYIADANNNCIRKVTASTGIITTIAGTGLQGYTGDGGPATNAKLSAPYGVGVDVFGDVYIADYGNHRIRKVSISTGLISTIAGTGTGAYSGDGGQATSAQLFHPYGLFVHGSGDVYITDTDNARVRKVSASTGIITTIAGIGTPGTYTGEGGLATSAKLGAPSGIYAETNGNVYFTDFYNNKVLKINASTSIITTLAGIGTQGFSGDGGAAINAEFISPTAVFKDASGNLYIADSQNNRIRKITGLQSGIKTAVMYNREIEVFPNPATQCLHLQGIEKLTLVKIYNADGSLIIQKESATDLILNTDQLKQGVYTLIAENDQYRVSKKIIVIK